MINQFYMFVVCLLDDLKILFESKIYYKIGISNKIPNDDEITTFKKATL